MEAVATDSADDRPLHSAVQPLGHDDERLAGTRPAERGQEPLDLLVFKEKIDLVDKLCTEPSSDQTVLASTDDPVDVPAVVDPPPVQEPQPVSNGLAPVTETEPRANAAETVLDQAAAKETAPAAKTKPQVDQPVAEAVAPCEPEDGAAGTIAEVGVPVPKPAAETEPKPALPEKPKPSVKKSAAKAKPQTPAPIVKASSEARLQTKQSPAEPPQKPAAKPKREKKTVLVAEAVASPKQSASVATETESVKPTLEKATAISDTEHDDKSDGDNSDHEFPSEIATVYRPQTAPLPAPKSILKKQSHYSRQSMQFDEQLPSGYADVYNKTRDFHIDPTLFKHFKQASSNAVARDRSKPAWQRRGLQSASSAQSRSTPRPKTSDEGLDIPSIPDPTPYLDRYPAQQQYSYMPVYYEEPQTMYPPDFMPVEYMDQHPGHYQDPYATPNQYYDPYGYGYGIPFANEPYQLMHSESLPYQGYFPDQSANYAYGHEPYYYEAVPYLEQPPLFAKVGSKQSLSKSTAASSQTNLRTKTAAKQSQVQYVPLS
ncbi:hypothetical protein HDU91_001661, partial [Kappamyces sp. JEL0680]